VVTVIGPFVVPAGTVAVIWIDASTVKVAARPLNCTDEAPWKFAPVMTMDAPTTPDEGLKEVIAGDVTSKWLALVKVVAGATTATGPVVAPGGTVPVTWLSESTVKLAPKPSKVTLVAPVKPLPVIVTAVPVGPEVGEKGVTVKLVGSVKVPPGAVTTIGPVDAPDGTVAVTWESETTL
jgi:hypothetical protein